MVRGATEERDAPPLLLFLLQNSSQVMFLRLRYEQDKARNQVSDGLDLAGQPSRKLIAVTQYCKVDKP